MRYNAPGKHVPARAHGVSMPRREESEREGGAPPHGAAGRRRDIIFRNIINIFNIIYKFYNSGYVAS